jgi:hypothetical protein
VNGIDGDRPIVQAMSLPPPDTNDRRRAHLPVTPAPAPPEPAPSDDERREASARRRFDRGGRRRADWPEDAGLTSCPGCGHEHIQSLGVLDSGDYLWQCPQCDRRFQTGRATRTML